MLNKKCKDYEAVWVKVAESETMRIPENR